MRFVVGLVLAAVIVGPPFVVAAGVRRRVWPGASGSVAAMACAVGGIALVQLNAQLLGLVGLFDLLPLLVLGLVDGVAGLVLFRRWAVADAGDVEDDATSADPDLSESKPLLVVAAGAVVILAAQWGSRIAAAYAVGVRDVDSLHYHLPHAARWAQTGSVMDLHYVATGGPPNMFHPSNAELLHGVGMLAFDGDILTPSLNAGWLALALLAAWCAGRRYGVGALVVLGTAVLLAMPFAAVNAGSALNDIPMLACLLAAVAFLLQRAPGTVHIAYAGAAAGLALSTKLTAVAPVGAATLALVLLAPRLRRWAIAAAWAVPLVTTGSFWYVRNLLIVGSPIPALDLKIFPVVDFPDVDRTGFTVADYLSDADVLRDWFLPGVKVGVSSLWWLVGLAVIVGVVGAFLRGSDWKLRVIACAAAAAAAAYLFTPNTAQGERGQPTYFALNIRYAYAAILLGLVLIPIVVARRRPAWLLGVGALYGVLFVGSEVSGRTALPGRGVRLPAWNGDYVLPAIVLTVVVALAAGAAWTGARSPRAGLVPLLAVAMAFAVIGGGYALRNFHLDSRYSDRVAYHWGDRTEDARIAIFGFGPQYPYYGSTLTNHVQFAGREVANGTYVPLASCEEWRGWLVDGRYDYVVLRKGTAGEREVGWTTAGPGATVELEGDGAVVYRLDGFTAGCG